MEGHVRPLRDQTVTGQAFGVLSVPPGRELCPSDVHGGTRSARVSQTLRARLGHGRRP